jgi:hypothetical protein
MAKTFNLLGLLSAVAIVVLPNPAFAGDLPKPCSQGDDLKIVSLSIHPDPLPDTSRVEEWLLRLRYNSEAECQTIIQIVETEREVVAAGAAVLIRSGANEIKLTPAPDYQFTANERCFKVVLKATGSKIESEDRQAFCALRIDNRWWTMR